MDIGKNKDKEIDFIVRNDHDLYYIQVAYTINYEDKKKQELSFFGLDDGYKKIVITMDDDPFTALENEYSRLNIFDFLFNEDA